ncbi:MAG: hypothetical protein SFV19_08720 [Rhodospirillaceae bacterium]|nr:hypothetical protein [Rhodospirillaceae bacterium]
MLFNGISSADRPAPDQIEVSVFGNGFGEAILIHLGNEKWLSVDSFRLGTGNEVTTESQPIALAYLKHIGVDPENAIKVLCASHWDTDHIDGISEVLRACPKALFVGSTALTREEFVAYVKAIESRPLTQLSTREREVGQIQDALVSRTCPGFNKFALVDREVFYSPSAEQIHGCDVRIRTLSPTDDQLAQFLVNIGNQIPEVRATKRHSQEFRPNLISVVLRVEIGNAVILLGADMEDTGNPTHGWTAILSSISAADGKKAAIFKIPHHGSQNGHNDHVWSKMLVSNPIALVTAFTRLREPLPTDRDRARITKLTSDAYIASEVSPSKSTKSLDRRVRNEVRAMGARIVRANPKEGFIRARSVGGLNSLNWSIDLFGTAKSLA